MELRQLKTFQAVARLSSFYRAAEILNYAPSTVSTQIKLLEEELDVTLFDRMGKGIRLTSAGEMLVRYARRILDMEEETLAKVSGWQEPHGTLSVRMPQSICTYMLPGALSQFQKRYPKIGLDVSTCAYDALLNELKTGMTDVAFLLADDIPFSELEVEVLRFETLVVVTSPNHALAQSVSFGLDELAGHPILIPKHDCSYKMVFEKTLVEENIRDTTFMELNSIEAIKQCVLQGIGVAMLPLMAVQQELKRQQLCILPWPEEKLETGLLMIRHKGKWLSPALQYFMDTIKASLMASKIASF